MSESNHYRPVQERILDHAEVLKAPTDVEVQAESRRCMDCGVPFCHGETGCPLGNLIPEWNAMATVGKWSEASDRLHATNNFPEFTSRLCPAPCESACVLDLEKKPVEIKSIERRIVDRAWENGSLRAQVAARKTERKVAVVGAGPAGLACAQQLARKGYRVTVFEREPEVGGLLRYGIPDFKMEKSVIDRRIAQMQAEGVIFKTGIEIGRDLSFHSLRAAHDVVAIAIGSERPRDLLLPGRTLRGVHFAMDYLISQNRNIASPQVPLSIDACGKDVIILGGGDTGSDCLGTALRQKAKSVRQLEIQAAPPVERSSSTPWPFWPLKFRSSHAHEEGGERHWDLTTLEFKGEDGDVRALLCRDNKEGSPFELKADLVILALGFIGVSRSATTAFSDLKVDHRGRIVTDARYQTSMESVYAAGDAKRGASLIVWAIAEGRKMAAEIHHQFQQSQQSQYAGAIGDLNV